MAAARDGNGPSARLHFLLEVALGAGDHAPYHHTISQHAVLAGGITIRNSAHMAAVFSVEDMRISAFPSCRDNDVFSSASAYPSEKMA